VKIKGLLVGVFGMSTFISLQANAQEQYYDFGFVGLSGQYNQSVFSDSNSDDDNASFNVAPDLFYYGEYGFINGGLVNVSVLPYLGISGQWRFSEVSDDVASFPNGIENREGNGELGITLGTVGARLTYLHDVTDEHNGYELQLHFGYKFDTVIENFTLTPYAEVDYRDKRLSQHLYSVSSSEALASGFNEYDAKASFVYQAGLIGLYSLSSDWLGVVKVAAEHHDSDSPLVQQNIGLSVSLGLSYQFTH